MLPVLRSLILDGHQDPIYANNMQPGSVEWPQFSHFLVAGKGKGVDRDSSMLEIRLHQRLSSHQTSWRCDEKLASEKLIVRAFENMHYILIKGLKSAPCKRVLVEALPIPDACIHYSISRWFEETLTQESLCSRVEVLNSRVVMCKWSA